MTDHTKAAPAPEGGAVSGPGGYLVKDFADGWYWTPNAALDHASGAPIWSVSEGRYETDPPAIATREEAPAEEGELASQIAILRKAANSPTPDEDAGLTPESALKSAQAWRAIASNVVAAFDRAQPPAREGAQPVAWKLRCMERRQVGVTLDRREADQKAAAGWEIEPLGSITHPAPDALRVAVAKLEKAKITDDPAEVFMLAMEALAALQAGSTR